jgi:hypothetical protein
VAEYHDLIVSVRVYDRAALHAAALKHAMTVDGLTEAGALELLGTPTAPDEDGEDGIDLSACLQMIFDPGVSPDGCDIEESRVEYMRADEDEEEA